MYVDGSETRGALNAEVKIKYGTFSGRFVTVVIFILLFLSFHPVCLTILQSNKLLFAEMFMACNSPWFDVDHISGEAYFTVWMAETPLELDIPDDNLAQISSWRIPDSIEK